MNATPRKVALLKAQEFATHDSQGFNLRINDTYGY